MQRQQRDVKVGGYLNERVRITLDTVPQDERGTYGFITVRYRLAPWPTVRYGTPCVRSTVKRTLYNPVNCDPRNKETGGALRQRKRPPLHV